MAANPPTSNGSGFGELALTFDDVLLKPGPSTVMPGQVDTGTRLTRAIRLGIPVLFAWTYSVGFFEKCGFHQIDKSTDLHPRVWSECLRCPFFVGCNENGMLKRLEGVPMPSNLPEPPPAQVPPGIR